ncbi:hypothetical protein OG618_37310 (plasmid) [Kitasatospora sp. NBC_01246]|uniref:hypothetical protein n=1 Tax=Kitasatospora sp. NBC_01246 TaxID=2903570 RepID=UPI002E370F62|nr:hypothetical protein [Kitasatospora sp. NBC_01246]
MTTARDALLAELLGGEDPDGPEHADARARIERLIDNHRAEALTEAADITSTAVGPLWHLDTVAEVRARLLAARL